MSAVAHIDEYKTGKFFSDDFRGDMSWNGYENNVLLRNEGPDAAGTPQFTDVAMALGADVYTDSRGIAVLDMDNDGDLDLAVNTNPGDRDLAGVPAALLRNDVGAKRHWLAVSLEGRTVNRDAVGAMVSVRAGDLTVHRQRDAGGAYAGQHTSRLYFGLDQAEAVDELTVRWPNGREERFNNLAVDGLIHIVEGEGLKVLEMPRLKSGDFALKSPESERGGGP